MNRRRPFAAVLGGVSLLCVSFLANVAAVEMARQPVMVYDDWGQGGNRTWHAYHVLVAPGDTLVIPPNGYLGHMVHLDIVEGGQSTYIEQGLAAPDTHYHADAPAPAPTYIGGHSTIRLQRPQPQATGEPTAGPRWPTGDANGLDIVYWIEDGATPTDAAERARALLLHPSAVALTGPGPYGIKVVAGWLETTQYTLYAVQGLGALLALAGAAGLARRPTTQSMAGLEGYALLAARAEDYVLNLRGLLLGAGILILFLGVFGAVAVLAVFDHLAFVHPLGWWRSPVAGLLLLGFAALAGAWALQTWRVHGELRRIQGLAAPSL